LVLDGSESEEEISGVGMGRGWNLKGGEKSPSLAYFFKFSISWISRRY